MYVIIKKVHDISMQYTITAPKALKQTVQLPASKSISNRALVIHALSGGDVLPENLSDCDDTEVIISALKDNPYEINIKAAGTAMRFMTAYLATRDGEEHVITGTERMKHRPIHILVDALRGLGADIEYVGKEGFPPLRIKGGKLEGGQLEVPGNVSSQSDAAPDGRPYLTSVYRSDAMDDARIRCRCRLECLRHHHRGRQALQPASLLYRERLERRLLLV